MSRTRSTVTVGEVTRAWEDLRAHPALQWIPPIWRVSGQDASILSQHVIRAVDRNLTVKVVATPTGMLVRLATGPLEDREVAGRVDPTSPATRIDPGLDVAAGTFDEAVIELRNAVYDRYRIRPGHLGDVHQPQTDPEAAAVDGGRPGRRRVKLGR